MFTTITRAPGSRGSTPMRSSSSLPKMANINTALRLTAFYRRMPSRRVYSRNARLQDLQRRMRCAAAASFGSRRHETSGTHQRHEARADCYYTILTDVIRPQADVKLTSSQDVARTRARPRTADFLDCRPPPTHAPGLQPTWWRRRLVTDFLRLVALCGPRQRPQAAALFAGAFDADDWRSTYHVTVEEWRGWKYLNGEITRARSIRDGR